LWRVLSAVLLVFPLCSLAWAQEPQGDLVFQVNSYTTAAQEDPSVAMDPNGNFVVVWTSRGPDGNGDGIFAQLYDRNGARIGGEFQVNSYTTGQQIIADVAVAPDGSFVVVWDSFGGQDGDSDGVFAQRFSADGTKRGVEFQVNTYTTYSQSRPAVAIDSNGDFVVVWDSYYQDGSQFGVYARRYAMDGTPVTGEFRVADGTLGTQDQPDVAMAPDGSFVVVWRDGAYTNVTDIRGKRYDASGAAQGSDFQVNTYTTGPQYQPTVAIASGGEFVVAWTGDYQDGNSTGIIGQQYGSDGSTSGTEFVVNSYTTFAQSYPTAAMTPGGDFVVAWRSNDQDGSDTGVFGQTFHRSGVALGQEIQINTFTAGRQAHPAVASGPDDKFIVVWADGTFSAAGLDGSEEGVLGRLFKAFSWFYYFII
jgi:hypothetical protein